MKGICRFIIIGVAIFSMSTAFGSLARKFSFGHDVYRSGMYVGDSPLVTSDLLVPGLYLRDNTDPFYFPSTVVRYQNQFIIEAKDNGGVLKDTPQGQPYGGFYLDMFPITSSQGQTLGMIINRVEKLNPYPLDIGKMNFLPAGKPIEFFWGMALGGIRTGAHLTYANASQELEAKKTTSQAQDLSLNLGADMKAGPGTLEMAFELASIVGTSVIEVDGKKMTYKQGSGVGVRGRYFFQMGSNLTITPSFLYFTQSPSFVDETKKDKIESQGVKTAYNFSLGGSLKTQKSMIFSGIGYFYEGSVSEQKKTTTNKIEYLSNALNFNAGLEHEIYDWLGMMLGMQYEILGNQGKVVAKNKQVNNRLATSPANFFSAGVKLAFGGLTVETVISEQLLYNGPFVLTGKASNLNALMSVTYQF